MKPLKERINNRFYILPILLSLITLTTACSRTFKKSSIELNPIFYPAKPDILKESTTLKIGLGDMELLGLKLVNHAKFIVISRDRLRFRIDLVHKWRSHVTPCDWQAWVKIDSKIYLLECDKGPVKQLTWMWDKQRRRVLARNRFGDPTEIERFERHSTMLTSIVVFVGKASLNVYKRNVISKNTKTVKLTLKKEGTKFVFIWKLRKPDPNDK